MGGGKNSLILYLDNEGKLEGLKRMTCMITEVI